MSIEKYLSKIVLKKQWFYFWFLFISLFSVYEIFMALKNLGTGKMIVYSIAAELEIFILLCLIFLFRKLKREGVIK